MKNILFVALSLMASMSFADTGFEGAIRKEIGRFVATAVVTGSSTTGTAFVSAKFTRPDGMYFNNTSSTIWLGTTTATVNGAVHTNIAIGFPVLSSATFVLQGSMTGAVNFTCNSGVGSCEVRAFEGLMK